MTYAEFVTKYEQIIREMLRYDIKQIGSLHFAEKAADLADSYPEFMEKYDCEN